METIGRLTAGKSWLGPEWYGCMNTGCRPMLRVPTLDFESTGWILVGDESDVREVTATPEGVRWLLRKETGKREFKRVWKFRTRAAALRKFQELIDKVEAHRVSAQAEKSWAELILAGT
jgi:hypothetical protein